MPMRKSKNKFRFFIGKMAIPRLGLLAIFSFAISFSSSCIQNTNSQVPPVDSIKPVAVSDSFPLKKTVALNSYSVFYAGDSKIHITSTRPEISKANFRLAFAGAFTLLDDYSIDGLFIENGNVKKKSANHHLGGGLLINENSVKIIKTFDGKLLTEHWRDSVAAAGSSFFQQIQLVRADSALRFGKDQKLFQRRAFVIFKNGKAAMIESDAAITLQTFANDLVSLGVRDALYTDMGGWDEAWYRDANGKMQTIGLMRSSTSKQSNWVVFE